MLLFIVKCFCIGFAILAILAVIFVKSDDYGHTDNNKNLPSDGCNPSSFV
jgi:hypothetical protein